MPKNYKKNCQIRLSQIRFSEFKISLKKHEKKTIYPSEIQKLKLDKNSRVAEISHFLKLAKLRDSYKIQSSSYFTIQLLHSYVETLFLIPQKSKKYYL